MKVLYNGSIRAVEGGFAESIYLMMSGALMQSIDAELFTYENPPEDVLLSYDLTVHTTKRPKPAKWNIFHWSYDYKRDLSRIKDVDIYHANGVWMYNTYGFIDVAKKMGKPYVVMPHAMLYPQVLTGSNSFAKRLMLRVRVMNDLDSAACIIATCETEKKNLREIGVTTPIAVIPNPVDTNCKCKEKKQGEGLTVGYIGRISRIKNIESLIYAWNELAKSWNKKEPHDFLKSKLRIVGGGGDAEYENFLKSEVSRLGLSNVEFTGMLSGIEKENALQSFDVLVLPSKFENFGMVITEGMARGIPCIATYGAPWQDLEVYNAGLWVPNEQSAIDKAVEKLFFMDDEALYEMGQNGRKLAEEKYSVEHVSRMFKEVYKWILGQSDKPEFIEVL